MTKSLKKRTKAELIELATDLQVRLDVARLHWRVLQRMNKSLARAVAKEAVKQLSE